MSGRSYEFFVDQCFCFGSSFTKVNLLSFMSPIFVRKSFVDNRRSVEAYIVKLNSKIGAFRFVKGSLESRFPVDSNSYRATDINIFKPFNPLTYKFRDFILF